MELIQNSYERYTVLPQAEQQKEVTLEVIVPDTQADVYSVLTTFAICQVKQKTLHKDCVTVEGLVEIEAFCQEEEEDRWQNIRGTIPFVMEVEAPGCKEDSITQLRMEVLRCDAQIRNPRKLQLQAQLSASVQVYQKTQLLITESIGSKEEEDIQLLYDTVELDILQSVAEKKLVAADELQLNVQGRLLYYQVDWRQEEQRVLSGKVMLRGSACVQAAFFKDGQMRQQDFQIPFSQVVECDGLEPGDAVTADYQLLQSQVTLLEGEAPALSCSLTGTVTACVTRKLRLSVLQDAYSTRYHTDCVQQRTDCPVWKSFSTMVPVEDLCQPQETVLTVLDCRLRARGFTDERGCMGGIYTARVLYCCEAGRMHCAEHTMKVVGTEPAEAQQLTVRAGWQNASAQAENGAIRIRFTAALQGRGLVSQHCQQVTQCHLDESKRRAVPPAGTLVLRTVEEQETVWSIAKHYGSRTKQILAANKLERDGSLIPGKLMMIPFCD